jgi:hypothetical protein
LPPVTVAETSVALRPITVAAVRVMPPPVPSFAAVVMALFILWKVSLAAMVTCPAFPAPVLAAEIRAPPVS